MIIPNPETQTAKFYIDDLISKERFQTGDLLLFSCHGPLAVYTKLLCNIQFSSLGLIVVLPNKYTQKNEYYVLEITRNLHEIQDSFCDRYFLFILTLQSLCIYLFSFLFFSFLLSLSLIFVHTHFF